MKTVAVILLTLALLTNPAYAVITGTIEGVASPPGGSSAFNDVTSGTNTTATMTIGTGASLATSGSGTIVATALTFDVATQAELDTHAALTNPHSATALNTASRIVLRDGSGNFAAGTITAALIGNASSASAVPFSGVSSGTNTTGAMVISSGASIELFGTGTIRANIVESRWLDQTDTATIAINCSLYDHVRIDELSQTTTFNAPTTCTPKEHQGLTIAVFSTTARTVTFSTGAGAFSAGYGLALPTTTAAGQWLLWGFRWNGVLARWALVAATPDATP